MNSCKVILAIHHEILRQGIEMLLDDIPEFSVVTATGNGEELPAIVRENNFDVLVLDMEMPTIKYPDLIKMLKTENSEYNILALSNTTDPNTIKEIIQAGVSGFVHKEEGTGKLLKAIETVSEDELYLCNRTIHLLTSDYTDNDTVTIVSDTLTKREVEVLGLICEEYTNNQIAHKLNISTSTVKTHRSNIMKKIGAHNTAGLVKYAIKHELISL